MVGGRLQINEGLWVQPGVPELVQQQELKKLAKTYGKFWCTWQFDRGMFKSLLLALLSIYISLFVRAIESLLGLVRPIHMFREMSVRAIEQGTGYLWGHRR